MTPSLEPHNPNVTAMSKVMIDHPILMLLALGLAAVTLLPWGRIGAFLARNPAQGQGNPTGLRGRNGEC